MEQICGIRCLDEHGRLSIPIDIRRNMGIKENSKVEMYYNSKQRIFSVKPLDKEKQFLNQIEFIKDLSNYFDENKKEKISNLIENIKNIFIEGEKI